VPNCHETRKVLPFPKNLQEKKIYQLSGSDIFYRPFSNTPFREFGKYANVKKPGVPCGTTWLKNSLK